MNRKFLLIAILIIISINIAIYSKTASYDFVRLDDDRYIITNPLIKKLDIDNIKKIFTQSYIVNYQPIILLSYAVEFNFFKYNAGKYHLTSTIIHIINTILVLLLIYAITQTGWVAFIIALLFTVHPIQVESVAWISEQKGLLCTFLYLLAFMAYIRYCRGNPLWLPSTDRTGTEALSLQKKQSGYYLLSLLLFLFALLTKPMAVTLPIILLLFDYYEGKLTKSKIIEKLPFILLAGGSSIVTIIVQGKWGTLTEGQLPSLTQNFFFAFYIIGFYISKLIIPIKLSVYYEYPSNFGFTSKEFMLAVLVLAAMLIYFFNIKKIRREINFGVLFFLISLIPILKIIPIGKSFAADRYMYIPMIGFFFAVIMMLRFYVIDKRLQKILIAALVLYALSFLNLAYSASNVWQNTYTLGKNALRYNPDYYEPYPTIGYFFIQQRNPQKALEYLRIALKNPKSREIALLYSGIAYFDENNFIESKNNFIAILDEFPYDVWGNRYIVYTYLGVISVATNNYSDALKYYEQGLKLNPTDPQIHRFYADLMKRLGNTAQAKKHYELAESLKNK